MAQSPDDEHEDLAAWADSCFVKDDDDERRFSDAAWTSFTDDFISALASLSVDASASTLDDSSFNSPDSSAAELISRITAATFNRAGADHSDLEAEVDFSALVEETRAGRPEAVVIGKEFPAEHDYGEEVSSVVISGEEEDLPTDLFKVWDLMISDEEGELSSQLKDALQQSSLGSDDPKLEALVSAVSDLSISSPPARPPSVGRAE